MQHIQSVQTIPPVIGHEDAHTRQKSLPSFSSIAMTALLDGERAALRRHVRQLLQEPRFARRRFATSADYRAQVTEWLGLLADEGLGGLSYPEEFGGGGDVGGYLAVFETLAFHDLSLLVKYGVQFGLFGGAIYQLGTAEHHRRYLPKIASMELPGCFAMTETNHGSNVRDVETTAVYDPTTEEFEIHTPHRGAYKDYIGNAARDGKLAIVFAQLSIGDDDFGVHALLVPIRTADGQPAPGVTIEDVGEKLGLNGVDNGRLAFDRVRVPRTALLDRFAQVTPEGEYQSDIVRESRRFFTMLGTLVGGRIAIATAAVSAAKAAQTIAVRYALQRRQFGPPGARETLLLDYPTHQRRLLPDLAKSYAFHFGLAHLTARYENRTQDEIREIEALAAVLKALSTWHATATIQACREACGGQGYLAENGLAALKADTDVFTTFEGDNMVLMQLAAKARLSDFRQQFSDMGLLSLARYVTGRVAHGLSDRVVPLIALLPRRQRSDAAHLRDANFQLGAFRHREEALLQSAAARIKHRMDAGQDLDRVLHAVQNHLIELARAYGERVLLEQFVLGVDAVDDATLRAVLDRMCSLFALATLEEHKGWYLEHGLLDGGETKAIRDQVDRLCAEVRPDAAALVDAFAIPDALLASQIGVG
jgi:acyl-CoA oxidase